MQADLVEKLKSNTELTNEEKKQLKKMGIDEKDANAASLLEAKSGNDIWASMSMDQKDMLESGNKTLQYEKDIADRQTSIMDKLGILVDFIMNQVYNILVDTVDGIESLLHPMDASLVAAKRQIRLSKDKDLMDALAQHGASGEDLQKAILKTPVFKDIDDNMGKLYTEYKNAAAEEKTTTDEARKKELQARKREIEGKLKAAVSRVDITGTVDPKKVKDALKTTSISADKINAIMKDMKDNGTDFSAALYAAGATEEQRVDAMKAVYKKMDTYELSLYAGSLKKAGWGTTGAPPPGTTTDVAKATGTTPNAQQQAATKSAAPGTAGTTATTTTAAPTTKGAPATTTAVTPPPTAAIAKAAPVDVKGGPTDDQTDQVIGGLNDLYKALRRRGIVLDSSFMRSDYKSTTHDAVYDAMSEALYEFAVLTQWDKVAKWSSDLKTWGVQGASQVLPFMKTWSEQVNKGTYFGNQAGGTVTGVTGGMANIARFPPAPAGEGWASVGPGEKILPAGAGGGGGTVKVQLELKGDMLNQIIKAKATDAAADHDYKKRFR